MPILYRLREIEILRQVERETRMNEMLRGQRAKYSSYKMIVSETHMSEMLRMSEMLKQYAHGKQNSEAKCSV